MRETICHVVAMTVGIGVVLPFLWMLLDRRSCIEIRQIEVLPPVVRPGELTVIRLGVGDYNTCYGEIHRIMVDSLGTNFDMGSFTSVLSYLPTEDSHLIYAVPFHVPLGVAPGPAQYFSHSIRWRNFVQYWVWPMRDTIGPVKFTVQPLP